MIIFRGKKTTDNQIIEGNLSTNTDGAINVISQITPAQPVDYGQFRGWCFAVKKESVEQLLNGEWVKCYC